MVRFCFVGSNAFPNLLATHATHSGKGLVVPSFLTSLTVFSSLAIYDFRASSHALTINSVQTSYLYLKMGLLCISIAANMAARALAFNSFESLRLRLAFLMDVAESIAQD